MPSRIAAIRRAIEERQDFSVLANGGEDAVVRWAAAHGANGRTVICEWQANFRQRQAQAERTSQARQVPPQSAGRPARIETELLARDLDYWPDLDAATPDDPDDPDDGEQQQTQTCPSCDGKGRGHDGDVCEQCGGSGRVPIDAFDDDDDDEDNHEFEDE